MAFAYFPHTEDDIRQMLDRIGVGSLEDAPELLNEDAFANWIMKVEMSDPSELESLMDAAAYEAMCANE